jgi:cytochrome c biogenesis protein CcdA/thiol-disulfide isomerase/thioredoxin
MILFLLAYLGGVLTIVSPCILPVLPFVFARADQPFVKSGLPLLVGMAVTFALVATLAAVGGGWAVSANQYGRWAAIALLALFGITLLFPSLADRLTQPLVALGARLSQSADAQAAAHKSTILPSLLLGVATGLLWAPCAGPVLGLILTGAALKGANVGTTVLLLAYALGAATSLALALMVGGRVFALMKRSLGVGQWVRRALGVLVLAAVVAIAMGVDTGLLTRVSLSGTASLEQGLLNTLRGVNGPSPTQPKAATATPAAAQALPVEGKMPELTGAVQWLNSPPLTAAGLKGKVVLVDFWTYSCINCIRSLPYVRAWAQKYGGQGLVVIGVHAPEFAFEKDIANVKKAVADFKITYPVAIDNDDAIWRAFNNEYWPADYLIDAKGFIRAHHFGEGDYAATETQIQQLLAEAGKAPASPLVADTVQASGAQAAADANDVQSPETYVGYDRAEHFVSPGGAAHDRAHVYSAHPRALNSWGLIGDWTVTLENGALNRAGGAIVYRFHARDLHLVLGPGDDGKPVRFKVTIDGAPPGASHGVDADPEGNGVVTGERLYQLIRQSGPVTDHSFEIQFLDPRVRAYAFTFG